MRDDRKIGRIAVTQGDSSLAFALRDTDGGEYMDGFVWLVPLPSGTIIRDASARSCNGTCRLALDPKRPGDVVVLVGFDVNRVDGDGHVKRFSVGPAVGSPSEPVMQIKFNDDDFDYTARVQYAYVRAEDVSARRDVQRRYEQPSLFRPDRPGPNLVAETARGDAVLQSFAFTFRDGGHFLEDVGVERRASSYEAWFQDGQSNDDRRRPDDAFAWRVRYTILD